MFGLEPVTVVMHGSTGGYQDYEILYEGGVFTFSDNLNEYAKVVQTTKDKAREVLEEHDVDLPREHGTIVIEHYDAREYLELELHPERQDAFIGALTQHPSARVEGHVTDTENKTIEVEYTFIPGL